MKKIFSILSLVLMLACCNFALTSCSSDDDDEDTNDDKVINKLVGTWRENDTTEMFESRYTFNADGTYLYTTKYIKPNPTLVIVTDKEGYITKHKGTYTVSKDKLTLKQEFGCYPTNNNNPDAEWEKDNEFSYIVTFELLENDTVIRFHGVNESGKNFTSADYKKVK